MELYNLAQEAQTRIKPYIDKTPLVFNPFLSRKTGKHVWLKLECQQITGAFKVRAAFNAMLLNLDAAKETGVLTTSSGNYAQAVAYAAKKLGVQATIVMTNKTAPIKVEKTKALGAEVVFCGDSFQSRFDMLDKLKTERGGVVLHGFDSIETIAGNGTIALEIIEDLENEAISNFSIFCQASGGGLISGIAAVVKEQNPRNRVFGFQPSAGGAIIRSLKEGERVDVGNFETIADALVASKPGELTFQLIQKYVDVFDTVTDDEIVETLKTLHKAAPDLIVEPGGAVSVAGLLKHTELSPHDTVVCILSGGNIAKERRDQFLI